jgi:hypothetical protein
MEIPELIRFLIYSAVINYAVLIVWFLAFVTARGQLYRLHGKWFRLSPEGFDATHYAAMAVYKLGILLFTVVPAIALYLSTK